MTKMHAKLPSMQRVYNSDPATEMKTLQPK